LSRPVAAFLGCSRRPADCHFGMPLLLASALIEIVDS